MMTIKILGSGCRNCVTLAENARLAALEAGIKAELVKVTDFAEISKYGIMSTPGLVIDEKVVSCGKVLRKEDIAALLKTAMPSIG